VQTEQSEHPLLVWVKVLVGDSEGGGDAQVAYRQLADASPLVTKPFGKAGGRPSGSAGEASGGDPDRQWQEPAELHDLGHRRVLVVESLATNNSGKQFDGLVICKNIQGYRMGALEPSELASASDEYGATRSAREQVANLPGGCDIVEYDEHPLPREHGAIQTRPFLY
jgi:hypothetical protein